MSAAETRAPAPLFVLEDVAFAVEGRSLLAPLTITLPKGRLTGLVGHNGSGKSTLLKVLARQQVPTAGRTSFDGRPLERWPGRAYARRVAYLPQHPPPADGLTVAELVALGRYPWHGPFGRFGPGDRAKAAEAMALTSVAALAGRRVDTLSGGERQRAWLAMLVAQDTQCMLLDEPIAALDVAHQMEVLALVRRLARERGLGIVVVLHDVNLAARFCDEILALHSGRLIAKGTPASIMTAERLEAIYGVPMDVLACDAGYSLAHPR